ncbi:MAG: hypothetical protein EOP22_07935 [Hyphomicrobiales bacterium]|nr:MAG: hypothetical protein EOP22_07935 [Hyphomicrobiales bacterium]
MMEEERKRRVVDTSNGEARRAVAITIASCGPWQQELAKYTAWAERRRSSRETQEMLDRCDEIEVEVRQARVALIEGLMDAPRRVAGHSRVADVEKALDGIGARIEALRRQLRPN